MMWGYYPGMAWWMIIPSLIWLLLIGVAVWAFVRWVREQNHPRGRGTANPATSDDAAMEILRQRYARGEIDEATFERMRARLEASTPERTPPVTVG